MVGDIEEAGGVSCVSCPLHSYKVTLATGEKLYRATEMVDGKLVPLGWRSAGRRQRVHAAEERGGGVWVQLDGDRTPLESDKYACRERPGLAAASR